MVATNVISLYNKHVLIYIFKLKHLGIKGCASKVNIYVLHIMCVYTPHQECRDVSEVSLSGMSF